MIVVQKVGVRRQSVRERLFLWLVSATKAFPFSYKLEMTVLHCGLRTGLYDHKNYQEKRYQI